MFFFSFFVKLTCFIFIFFLSCIVSFFILYQNYHDVITISIIAISSRQRSQNLESLPPSLRLNGMTLAATKLPQTRAVVKGKKRGKQGETGGKREKQGERGGIGKIGKRDDGKCRRSLIESLSIKDFLLFDP